MTMLTTSFAVQQNIKCQKIHWNYTPEKLIEHSLRSGQGVLSDQGALCIRTGTFTGRSPKDKFIVKDEMTANTVDWNEINQPISTAQFDDLAKRMLAYAENLELYGQDVYACADERYRLNVRVMAQFPWSCQFAHNMFKNPTKDELIDFKPDWTILCLPMFKADPKLDGTRQGNFTIVNFTKKTVLIGGSGYTGEIKKSIFSVLNYMLPLQHGVLPMHCSANVGETGDMAIFFGLSGTGKTTLSTDPNRQLIGDDEHGWSDEGVFNFEGGCYAKCINLSEEKEPEIYQAIRHGAILENITFKKGKRIPDFDNSEITQNSRVSYPINHINNIMPKSKGGHPKNIFFLTCDAFGVLPPIAKLTKEQAKKYFLLGYTSKVAGTETGINEPQMTFSACFGAPFLPLAPEYYADMLVEKMEEYDTNVWLVNTGWIGGAYGVGNRIALKYTRALVQTVLQGKMANMPLREESFFGLHIPVLCTGVPHRILDPQNTWADTKAYAETANRLKQAFEEKMEENATLEMA